MKKEFEVISQIIQNNKRVLDIGCGDGTLMEYLKVINKMMLEAWSQKRILYKNVYQRACQLLRVMQKKS